MEAEWQREETARKRKAAQQAVSWAAKGLVPSRGIPKALDFVGLFLGLASFW